MNVLFLVGRILFGGYFIYNGIDHFANLKAISGYAASKGVRSPQTAVIITAVLLLIGGIADLLGIYPTIGLISLIVFLVPVTLVMYAYWADADPNMKMADMVNFGKNIALLGAALEMFILPHPWPLSVAG
jgi:uncharacterized membrane protein YphA (DoxX/SURF4 family)